MQTALKNTYVTTPSGTQLEFSICNPYRVWEDLPGIYIFCRNEGAHFLALYVGQALKFSDRFSAHHVWARAQKLGMTTIMATVIEKQADRDRIEKELIKWWGPELNTLLKN